MRLLLNNQSPVAASCGRWAAVEASSPASGPGNPTVDHYQASVCHGAGETAQAAFERAWERLLTYDVFPPRLIRFAICPAGRVAEGATIVQRVLLGRLALEMAVRVTDVWDRQEGATRTAGFSYVTLKGHPECGVATFQVRLDAEQHVAVVINARSRPGTLLTRFGRPGTRPFQRAITRAALRRMAAA